MISLPGYKITEKITASVNTVIYRGIRERDRQSVIVKVLKDEYPTLEDLTRLRHEYYITQNIDSQNIVKAYSLENYLNGYALILEDVIGQSLLDLFNSEKLPLRELLRITIGLTSTLEDLHRVPIIHKDIKPSNVIVNYETGQVKLSDFGIASRLDRETPTLSNPDLLEGTLAYISPEQTGRMNRSVDYRSDFYSLGATLYEMLTGQLPFTVTDPIELVHCHLAKQPLPPHEIKSDIPPGISDIVMKLLAKTAEDRYQTAAGLRYDLETCLKQLQKTGEITNFTPGAADMASQLLIPQKLYGRDREVNSLLAAFDRVRRGATEMMLVSGYSGIGKTRVVKEVHKPIVKARGYFIAGKFDQFKRNMPYSAPIQAVSDLIGQLLTESQARIDVWQQKLALALGSNGQAIVDVIPEVQLIIGPQPELPPADGAAESQNRFMRVFQQFIGVFCQPEHPLVLFLDDLQWADAASLKLIQFLMTSEMPNLLAIGAYRDNEVCPTHPLMQTIEQMQATDATISSVAIGPLQRSDIKQLVAETLRPSDPKAVGDLAELLFHKTGGNPFFLTQLLEALHSEKLLVYDLKNGRWQWDIAEIQAIGITDYNVVELIARNIQKLQAATQEILKLAACIGNQFSLEVLAIVNEESPVVTAAHLWAALQAGLILPKSEAYKIPLLFNEAEAAEQMIADINVDYKFLHDRVQQAAYSLIPEAEKQETHLTIGQLLLENTDPEENIFALVHQFNLAKDLLSEQSEKDELAQLNSIAGQKARAANAYEAAVGYLNIGLELLEPDSWQSNYDLTFALYQAAGEAQYLNANFEQSQFLSELALGQAQTLLDKADIYQIQIQAYIAQNQMQQAIDIAFQSLEMLGVTLESAPPPIPDIDDLIDLPEMTDAEKLAAMRILNTIFSAVLVAAPNLIPVVVFTMLSLSIKYGNSPLAAYGYCIYGYMLCGAGDIESGYRFGKLALKLLQQMNALELQSKVSALFYGCINVWKHHPQANLEAMIEGIKKGLEVGDIEYACHNAVNYCQQFLLIGKPLEVVAQKQLHYLDLTQKFRQEVSDNYLSLSRQLVLNLLGRSADNTILVGQAFNEDEMVPKFLTKGQFYPICATYYFKSLLSYLFREYAAAVDYANLASEYVESMLGFMDYAQQHLYYALALLAHYPLAEVDCRAEYMQKVEFLQEKMENWAAHAPENFQHKYDLIAAEKYRVLGDEVQAIALYDRAITGARENGYTHEEALANERAGSYHLARGLENMARFYIIESYYGYIRWGAIAKVRDLESQYPQFFARLTAEDNSDVTKTGTVRTTVESSGVLDLPTVLKAYQTISGEIQIGQLLDKLMKIVIENSGAQKGFLILNQDNSLTLSASGRVDGEEVLVQSDRVPLDRAVAMGVVNYVQRTQQSLVLSDAYSEGMFTNDPYIKENKPRSVLCTPMLNQGKLMGMLYLENNLTTDAFTRSRLEVVTLLAAQAAVSLENASLYANLSATNQQLSAANHQLEDYSRNLEGKVNERTLELQAKNQHLLSTLKQLEHTQTQLIQSEKMSSLGQMVAGIAHEINNPVNFISGNIGHAKTYMEDALDLLDLYTQYYPEAEAEIQEKITEVDLEFLQEDMPKLLDSMQVGTDRIRDIVLSLRSFSRLDEADMKQVDIHAGIDSTLLILQHRLSEPQGGLIEIIKDYGPLPLTECYAGQLNQVFLNILSNAIDVLAAYDQQPAPTIRLGTEAIENDRIAIRIADNGPGMTESVRAKVFDPFFTTKPVGKGTGLGLSLSYQIVVDQHGGQLTCESTPDRGTEFLIIIPINQPQRRS